MLQMSHHLVRVAHAGAAQEDLQHARQVLRVLLQHPAQTREDCVQHTQLVEALTLPNPEKDHPAHIHMMQRPSVCCGTMLPMGPLVYLAMPYTTALQRPAPARASVQDAAVIHRFWSKGWEQSRVSKLCQKAPAVADVGLHERKCHQPMLPRRHACLHEACAASNELKPCSAVTFACWAGSTI